MPTPRATLKSYFKRGEIPTEGQFAELIDSTLNLQDDGLYQPAGDPLSIKSVGADESLINFYRVVQGNNELTWQLKQNADNRLGLSFHHNGSPSRLFIDAATGNVGIGTTSPQAKLDVNGDIKASGGITASGDVQFNGKISSPMWKVSRVLDGSLGPLPVQGQFSSSGGTLLVVVSGMATARRTDFMKMRLTMDGSNARTLLQAGSALQIHKSFPASVEIFNGIAAGSHTVSIEEEDNANTDGADAFYATVIEFPF